MYPNMVPNLNLPPNWQVMVDNMGRYYYINPVTQQQSWTPPPGTTSGGTGPNNATGLSNSTSNFNSAPIRTPTTPSATSVTNHQNLSMPDGWEESTDSQGRVYYIDHVNKKTSWIHPGFSVQQLQQPVTPNIVVQPTSATTPSPIPIKPSNITGDTSYPSISEYGYSGNSNSLPKSMPTNTPTITNTNSVSNTNSSNTVKDFQRPRNTSLPSSKPNIITSPNISSSSPITSITPKQSSSSTTLLSHSAPLWDLEKQVPSCSNCYQVFTVIKRRHHCRCCQREFCGDCTTKKCKIPQFNHNDQVRVCDYCFNHQSQDEKTCISRLIPYLFENYRDPNQQYQALLEIYDYILSYDQASVEKALVGGLKPFLEYIYRIYKDSHQTEAVSLSTQIMETISLNEKMLKTLCESKDQIVQLFDIMFYSGKHNIQIQIDCSKILKNLIAYIIKNKKITSVATTNTTNTNTTTNNTNTTTTTNNNNVQSTITSLLNLGGSATNNNTANNTTNNSSTATVLEFLVPKQSISTLLSSLESISPSTNSGNNSSQTNNKEELQLQYLKIISKLIDDSQMKAELLNQNLISTITPLLLSSKADIINKVLSILIEYSLNVEDKTDDKFYASGGILFLNELIIKQIPNEISSMALKLLGQYLKRISSQYLSVMVDNALIHNLMLKFCDSVADFPLLLSMLSPIFEKYAGNMPLVNSMNNPNIIQALIAAVQSNKTELSALKIIESISINDQIKEHLIKNSVTDQLLLNLMDKSKSPSLPLSILANLAKNSEQVCQSIFEIGGLTIIVDILSTAPPKATTTTNITPTPTTSTGLLSPLSRVPYHDEPVPVASKTSTSTTTTSEDKLKEYQKVQLNCIKLLLKLSYSKNICKEFVLIENGKGIILLVQLLNPSNSDLIKEMVSETLSNLCEDETTAIIVLGEGGLAYTQALLSSNQVIIKSNALKLIQKLAIHSPDIKYAISEGTSIQKMVELLQNSNPDLKKSAIYSLSEICRENESNRDLAYKGGALNQLLACFNTFTKDIKILVCILEILSGFAQQDKYKQQLASSDITQSIIEYLFSSLSIQAKNSGEEGFIIQSQIYSTLILSKIITSNELIRKVIDSGIVLSLTPLLAIKNSYLQEYTLNTLHIIYPMITPDFKEMMVSNGILQSLADLLSSKNESILSDTLFILTELSKSIDCGGYLLSSNAMNIISDLVIQSKESIQQQAIKLISSLFENSSNQSNIWENYTQKAGIPGIIALLLLNNSLSISAANALSTIVADGPGRARIIESGGLQALLSCLRKTGQIDPLLFFYCLISLYGLSMEDEICSSLVNLGALPILLPPLCAQTIAIPNVQLDYKLYILETLVNIVSNAQCGAMISSNEEFISSITGILFQEHYKVLAAKILSLIPLETKTAELMISYGATYGLVSILSLGEGNEQAKLISMKSLFSLAKAQPSCTNEILMAVDDNNENGLSLLFKSLNSPQEKDLSLKLQILEFFELSSSGENLQLFEDSKTIDKFVELLHLLSKQSIINPDNKDSEKQNQTTTATTTRHLQFSIIFKTLIIISQLSQKNPKINNHLLASGFLNESLLSLLVLPPVKLVNDTIDTGVSLLDLDQKEPTTNPNSLPDLSNNFKDELKEYQDTTNKLILDMIYALSTSEKGKNIIRNMGTMEKLIRFMDSKHQEVIATSLKIITSLCISSLNRLELYTSGSFDKIYDVASKSSSIDVTLASLDCLYQLLFSEQLHNDFVKRVDFPKILISAISLQNEAIQFSVIKFIDRHLIHGKYIDILVEKFNIIQHFVNILNSASSENLILYLLRTLNSFLPFDQARASIHLNIPLEILKTLQSVPNITLRELSNDLVASFN